SEKAAHIGVAVLHLLLVAAEERVRIALDDRRKRPGDVLEAPHPEAPDLRREIGGAVAREHVGEPVVGADELRYSVAVEITEAVVLVTPLVHGPPPFTPAAPSPVELRVRA